MKRPRANRLRLAALLACAGLLAACVAQSSSSASPSATSNSPLASSAGSVTPSAPALAHLDGQLVFDHVASHFVSIWIEDGTGAHSLFPQDTSEQEKASWWSDGATLTFDRLLEGGARIFRRDPGAEPAQVATGCEAPCLEDGFSALSPDGTKLAFRRIEGTTDPTATRIVIADASGANAILMPSLPWSEGEYKSPRWSPDGAFLVMAFEAHKDAGGDISGSTLFVIDMADGSLRQLTPDGLPAAAPDWSASGLIVFGTDPGQVDATTKDIYVIAPDGSGMRNVTEGSPVAGSATTPRWIPGTDRIVFSHISGVITADIWVINADGTGAQQVTATGGEDMYPAVSQQ
jgi:Tol biopolymer transport system component